MANLSALMGGQQFDANQVEANSAYEPMPADFYPMMITDSELKDSKSGGQYLKLTIEVCDGAKKGRKVFSNLNLVNSNEKAVEIARRDLSAICHAVGVMTPQDTQELHYKPFVGKVKVSPAQNGYEASNDMAGYMPATDENASKCYSAQPAQKTQSNVGVAPSQAPSGDGGRPAWAN